MLRDRPGLAGTMLGFFAARKSALTARCRYDINDIGNGKANPVIARGRVRYAFFPKLRIK